MLSAQNMILCSVLLWYLKHIVFLQIKANPDTDPGYIPEPPEPDPAEDQELLDDGTVKGHWDKRLNSFQKLMFIRVFKEEKVSLLIIELNQN